MDALPKKWVANLIVPEDKVMSIYLLALAGSIQNSPIPNYSTTDAAMRETGHAEEPTVGRVIEDLQRRRDNCRYKAVNVSQDKDYIQMHKIRRKHNLVIKAYMRIKKVGRNNIRQCLV